MAQLGAHQLIRCIVTFIQQDGKAFLPFEEARELVRGIGLES